MSNFLLILTVVLVVGYVFYVLSDILEKEKEQSYEKD